MVQQLINVNAVSFVGLQSLGQEKSAFDRDGLPQNDCVITFVDLGNQIFHFVRVEGCAAHQQFVAHDTDGPHVYSVTVRSLLEQLGRAVQWGATN